MIQSKLFLCSLVGVVSVGTDAYAMTPNEAFEEVIAAYQNVPMLDDTLAYVVNLPGSEPQADSLSVSLGPDDCIVLDLDEIVAVARDKDFFVTSSTDGAPYLQSERAESFTKSLAAALGDSMRIPVAPQIIMREGASVAASVSAFGFGLFGDFELTKFLSAAESGELLDTFTAKAPGATLVLDVDPITHFVQHVELSGGEAGAGGISAKMDFTPKVSGTTSTWRNFNNDERIEIATIRGLMQIGPEIGQAAPATNLVHEDGSLTGLQAQRGSIVILDFWASWCGNCWLSLPHLAEIAQWASDSGIEVSIFPVNSMEEFEDHTQRLAVIEEWWTKLDMQLPWVIDENNAAASAFTATTFPTIVVIDREGNVAYTHSGYDPEGVEHIKAALQRLQGSD